MTKITELYTIKPELEPYINSDDVEDMYATVDNALSVPFLASLQAITGDMDLSTKMQLRMSYLGLVDAIEKDLGISPTTAQCRKMAKGRI